jgi:hypothetical protein
MRFNEPLFVLLFSIEKMQAVLFSVLTTLFFVVFKFVENKYLAREEEQKPLKELVRDAIVVFLCSLAVGYILMAFGDNINDFYNVLTETKTINPAATQIFTDEPGF